MNEKEMSQRLSKKWAGVEHGISRALKDASVRHRLAPFAIVLPGRAGTSGFFT